MFEGVWKVFVLYVERCSGGKNKGHVAEKMY